MNMNPIIEIPILGKAIRPPRQAINQAMPDREKIASYKKSSISTLFKDLPSLDGPSTKHVTSVTDDILMSLVWNNPVLGDLPVLGATSESSSYHEKTSKDRNEVSLDAKSQELSIKQFLNPPVSLDSLVNPPEDIAARNSNSLYRVASTRLATTSFRKLRH